jgi:arsenate reductase (glutaredoxin)
MPPVTIYVKPTCTTCRKAKDKLDEDGVAYETVDLFKATPTAAELGALCEKMGLAPRDILRSKDPAYEEHGLASGRHTDAQLLALMVKHPGLIQRPIVVQGKKAVLARPIEKIDALLQKGK